MLRKVLGGRPTYLPAFRSVLERARAESSPYYRGSDKYETELRSLVEQETNALSETLSLSDNVPAYEYRALREEANSTAQKTMQCRQWFGSFVPVIRYPSLSDVDEGLSEEWRSAHLETTRREQRMFQDTFVRVFRVISGLDTPADAEVKVNILAQIHEALAEEEQLFSEGNESEIYKQLTTATDNVVFGDNPRDKINNSILGIYLEALHSRNDGRKSRFEKLRDFSISVNKFLDRKELKIGSNIGPRSRGAVKIKTAQGQSYDLLSLSSGERHILTMMFSASRSKFSSGLFLIDEPELSLHIDWQRIVLKELKNQTEQRQVIACTHSPEVGADHFLSTQDFEPRELRQASLFPDEEI